MIVLPCDCLVLWSSSVAGAKSKVANRRPQKFSSCDCLWLSCFVISLWLSFVLWLFCLVSSWYCLVLSCDCVVLCWLVLSLSCRASSCLFLSCLVFWLSCLLIVLFCLLIAEGEWGWVRARIRARVIVRVLSCLVFWLSCLLLSCVVVLCCLVLSCVVLSSFLVLSPPCLALRCLVLLSYHNRRALPTLVLLHCILSLSVTPSLPPSLPPPPQRRHKRRRKVKKTFSRTPDVKSGLGSWVLVLVGNLRFVSSLVFSCLLLVYPCLPLTCHLVLSCVNLFCLVTRMTRHSAQAWSVARMALAAVPARHGMELAPGESSCFQDNDKTTNNTVQDQTRHDNLSFCLHLGLVFIFSLRLFSLFLALSLSLFCISLVMYLSL